MKKLTAILTALLLNTTLFAGVPQCQFPIDQGQIITSAGTTDTAEVTFTETFKEDTQAYIQYQRLPSSTKMLTNITLTQPDGVSIPLNGGINQFAEISQRWNVRAGTTIRFKFTYSPSTVAAATDDTINVCTVGPVGSYGKISVTKNNGHIQVV